jgi:hypothetical protein
MLGREKDMHEGTVEKGIGTGGRRGVSSFRLGLKISMIGRSDERWIE